MNDRNTSVNPGGLAALKNVARFLALVERLVDRGPHLPGLGVFHGFSGYGKSYASLYAWNKRDALRLEIGDSWTRKKFLEKLLAEADIKPAKRTIADLTEEAIMALGDDHNRPLIIDEADKLADKGMLELVREIQEHSQVPVLLIGEEQLPAKIMKVERVHNRVLDWVPAEPCDLSDARALADLFCPELTLTDDLLTEVVGHTKGVARRIVVNLTRMQEYGRNHRKDAFDAGAFERGWFFTSEPPRRGERRVA
ncbi:ATP-binding protein [Roseibium porphyridii]|uniref:ATP-binding protein n=1 Tax=Roseibium porphyridii TaxID=2866279 RepID=A0ABY8FDK2_9HYPH|nr:ATP-binding protein [Roseibium sp. KMA01]WFE92282.1 ATP-binding protein [Roseibium sp. KMA01]